MQEKQETKFDIECTGANLNLPQPATIEELVQFASNYTQNNMGVKHHAILLPFSALGSYNAAEAQYNGIRPLSWVESGTELLKDLNFEYVRLQRLKHVLMNNEHLETPSDAVYQDAKQKVTSI